ncbi:MAG UNVERIFIED_CONTAM: hypothetical protein LVQ98_03470 [Rickettsiaceae bacterium]
MPILIFQAHVFYLPLSLKNLINSGIIEVTNPAIDASNVIIFSPLFDVIIMIF